MSGAIPPLPNMPSWRAAQLNHKDNFTFYLSPSCSLFILLVVLLSLLFLSLLLLNPYCFLIFLTGGIVRSG
jgi:hypothetical protein